MSSSQCLHASAAYRSSLLKYSSQNLNFNRSLKFNNTRQYAVNVSPLTKDNVNQIRDGNGAIWISNTYRLGRWMNLVKIWYKFIGKKQEFQEKVHHDVSNSFDELQFPGIRQIIPSFKEGGCYVTFASKDQAKQILQELKGEVEIGKEVKRAHLVQGKPFIEDLSHVYPSQKLAIELADAGKCQQKLSPELLFHELRMYGRMQDIIVDPKKESAAIIFASRSAAISARNCLHFKAIGDTKFNIRYEPYSRFGFIYDWAKNPKILIPLLGIGISLSLYLLVGPTRVASVTQKLTRGVREEYGLDEAEAVLRQNAADQYHKHFRSVPDGSITVITGASGTGKSLLLRRFLNRRAFSIKVDCKKVKSVQEFLELFGDSIGFSPSFNALNTVLNWLESFIPGLKKTALSPSTKIQLESMLHSLDQVLFLISAGFPASGKEWDFPIIAFDGFHELLDSFNNQADADKEKSKELVDILLTWATNNSKNAHIVFVGENMLGEEILLSHPILKRSKVRIDHILDISKEETLTYLKQKLPLAEPTLVEAVDTFGGRISDIEAFISRAVTGLSPELILKEMINEAEQEVRNTGFGGKVLVASVAGRKWSQVHLWKAIKQIDEKGKIKYDELLFSAFSGDNEGLRALIKQKIFGIERVDGTTYVTPFSTLYSHAFRRLARETPKLRKGLDILEKKADIAKDMEEINKIEEELIKLTSSSTRDSTAIENRKHFLYTMLQEFNSRVEKKEVELRRIENS